MEAAKKLKRSTLEKVKALAARIDTKAYSDITVFVDPIDGTFDGRNFRISVKIKDNKVAYAEGSSKKNAEQAAANELLESIKL